MGNYAFFVYLGCIVMILIIGKIFIFPLKKISKLILNSVLGAVFIYFINIIGSGWGFHIGLNWGTILCSGILGVPGVVLFVILKLIL